MDPGKPPPKKRVPAGAAVLRPDVTESIVGGTGWPTINAGDAAAAWAASKAADSTSWDIFDAILTPGELILLISWKDAAAAQAQATQSAQAEAQRLAAVAQQRAGLEQQLLQHLLQIQKHSKDQ